MRLAADQRAVDRRDFLLEDVEGPAVPDQVVRNEHEHVVVRGKPEERRIEQRRLMDVDRASPPVRACAPSSATSRWSSGSALRSTTGSSYATLSATTACGSPVAESVPIEVRSEGCRSMMMPSVALNFSTSIGPPSRCAEGELYVDAAGMEFFEEPNAFLHRRERRAASARNDPDGFAARRACLAQGLDCRRPTARLSAPRTECAAAR